MNPWVRENILFVHGGDPRNLVFLYHLMNHAHGPELITTLRKRGLIGNKLTDFIFTKCNGEPIKFLHWCIKQTQNVNAPKTPRINNQGLME